MNKNELPFIPHSFNGDHSSPVYYAPVSPQMRCRSVLYTGSTLNVGYAFTRFQFNTPINISGDLSYLPAAINSPSLLALSCMLNV